MPVPAKELEYYRTLVPEEALTLLAEVMQTLFVSSAKATIRVIRNYLTLIGSDEIEDIKEEDIEFILREYYKREFINVIPEGNPQSEELKKVGCVLPSPYSLRRTAQSQYDWLVNNYQHRPVYTVDDDIATNLLFSKLFGNCSSICPDFEDRLRTYLFGEFIKSA